MSSSKTDPEPSAVEPPEPVGADKRRQRLSARLPLLYFALAHLSLAAAFAEIALEPQRLVGFYYHPRMIAVVHLVTLGWISGSILGALHLVGPMALRTPMPARRLDYWAYVFFFFGSTGVVGHFWIEEYSGVAWSGLMLTVVFARVGWKLLRPLRQAPVAAAVRVHFTLAFFNIGLAALAGTLLGLNKHIPFLPGRALTHAFGHAHLAALGWATLMVFAAGYRLLPMLLPAAMPSGRWLWTSAALLELGVLGLFVAFLVQGSWLPLAATACVAGIAAFFGWLGWMLRHPRPAPKALIRPDYGVAQVAISFIYLGVTCGLGLYLSLTPASEHTLRLAKVYGVCGLLGFLSQIVVGVSARLMPIFARLLVADWSTAQLTPHELPDRRLQAATFGLWLLGVPALATGFYLEQAWILSLAAWTLLAAVVAGGASHWVVLRAARPPRDSRT
ncbi:MAG: hypothetical protein AAF560_01675 [Acidobacteriota bacterium]